MANGSSAPPSQPGPPGGGFMDVITQLQGLIRQITALVTTIATVNTTIGNVLPRVLGTFTLAAAASTVVAQPQAQANSSIRLTPTDASAATLMGSAKSLYLASISPGVSFTVSTANGTNAAGTETFQYALYNPV
jgi:hypothetical protein